MKFTYSILFSVLLGSILLKPCAANDEESALKAAFVFNFAKLVSWPPMVMEGSPNLVLCAFENNPHNDELAKLHARKVQDKELSVRVIKATHEIAGCHIAVLDNTNVTLLRSISEIATKTHILTVGESQDFAQLGGIIELTTAHNKIRFNINANLAEKSGLLLSSKLLRLANKIY